MMSFDSKQAVDALLWSLHPDEEHTSTKMKDIAIEDIIDTIGVEAPMTAKEIWLLQDQGNYDKIYSMLSNLTK